MYIQMYIHTVLQRVNPFETPKKRGNKMKEKTMIFRVTKDEENYIKNQARKNEMTTSEFIRKVCTNWNPTFIYIGKDKEYEKELMNLIIKFTRTGNLIKKTDDDLIKLCRKDEIIPADIIYDIFEELKEQKEEIQKTMNEIINHIMKIKEEIQNGRT